MGLHCSFRRLPPLAGSGSLCQQLPKTIIYGYPRTNHRNGASSQKYWQSKTHNQHDDSSIGYRIAYCLDDRFCHRDSNRLPHFQSRCRVNCPIQHGNKAYCDNNPEQCPRRCEIMKKRTKIIIALVAFNSIAGAFLVSQIPRTALLAVGCYQNAAAIQAAHRLK